MSKNAFLEGMSRAASSVSAVTTGGESGNAGVTVSSMCSVSAEPPMLLVCIHHQSPACQAIRNNGVFCVNMLRHDQSSISDLFAGRSDKPNKFLDADWSKGLTGAPKLKNSLVNFDCHLVAEYRAGSHFVFIGGVAEINISEGKPLLYGSRLYGHPSYFDKEQQRDDS